MHHVRSVAKIRNRIRQGDKISAAIYKGAIQRKQIPLCQYHHNLYHSGQLTEFDMRILSKFTD